MASQGEGLSKQAGAGTTDAEYGNPAATPVHWAYAGAVHQNLPAVFGVTLSLQLLGAAITLILHLCDKNVIVMDTDSAWNYRLRGSNVTTRDDAWNAMVRDAPNTWWSKTLPNQAERHINFNGQELELYYDGSCFTPENLASMQAFEDEVMKRSHTRICDLERYNYTTAASSSPSLFGPAQSNATAAVPSNATTVPSITATADTLTTANSPCRKMDSVLRLFDGTYEGALGLDGKVVRDPDANNLKTFRPDPSFGRIRSILRAAFTQDGSTNGGTDLKVLLQYSVGVERYNLYDIHLSTHCRSKMHSGAPLSGYENIQDRLEEQREKMGSYHVDDLKSYLEDHDRVGSMDVHYTSAGLEKDALADARWFSLHLTIGSLLITFFALVMLLRSIFLPLMLLVSCVGTLFWTNLAYRYMFDFQWYGLPMQLSPFVICYFAIVHFVLLFSEWQKLPSFDMHSRLCTSMRQANISVVVSCLITMVAFFSHCFSKLVVVQCTGLFFGIAAFVNMMTYLTYYPALIAVWQQYVAKYEKFLHKKSSQYSHQLSESLFKGAIGHKLWRWFVAAGILIILSTLIIITVRQASREKKQPITWRKTNNYGQVDKLSRADFGHSSSGHQMQLHIVWGLHNLDQEECHESDHHCLGDPIYDNLFDLSSATAQNKLAEFCENLRTLDGTEVNTLRIQRLQTGPVVPTRPTERPTEIKCFILAQKEYYDKYPNASYEEPQTAAQPARQVEADVSIPFSYPKMASLMKSNPAFYQPEVYKSAAYFPPYANPKDEKSCNTCDSYYRHYEISALNWLTNGGNGAASTSDLEKYVGLFGGAADATLEKTGTGNMRYAGDYGSFIRYAAVEVNLTISSNDADYEEATAVFDEWDKYVAKAVENMPLPLKQAFQTTPADQAWAWMRIQQVLISETLQGCGIAVGLMFVILTLYTNNYGVAFLATVMATAVPTMVVGIYTFSDWKFGLYEAINLVFPIALSVDSIVHFAIWYTRTEGLAADERLLRARRAYIKVAPGVTAGCALLFAGALFLLGSPLEYVFTVGVTLTGSAAAAYAAATFMVILLGICGPVEDDLKLLASLGKHKIQPAEADESLKMVASPLPFAGDAKAAEAGLPLPPVAAAEPDSDNSDESSDDEQADAPAQPAQGFPASPATKLPPVLAPAAGAADSEDSDSDDDAAAPAPPPSPRSKLPPIAAN